ncbi:MAG: hypothetical protein HFG80_13815 [Eubacterium sp.]|nr:hypothetical protein [Eubacterium sp.]
MKKFEQLKRLYKTINGYLNPYDFSDEMISGLTADFDRLFELSWKTLKEYMQDSLMMQEAKTGSPKEIIKLAYREHLMDDEQVWINMLKDRNDDTHHYKNSAAVLYTGRIVGRYLEIIKKLIDELALLIPTEEIPDFRVPETFIDAVKKSGMSLDAFVQAIKAEHKFRTDDEIFIYWEEIKGKYV